MENSTSQTNSIKYILIAISAFALFGKNFIDQQYIEHQNEILRIIGLGGFSIVNFISAKYEEVNSKSRKFSLILAGILGSIAIGNLVMLVYPVLKNLF